MPSITQALQIALYQRLSSALASHTPPVPVFDRVPQGQSFPFVEITRILQSESSLLAEKMTDYQIVLSVYSNYEGQLEVNGILDAIDAALDDAPLVMTTGTMIRLDRERADSILDADGVTHTGSAIYTAVVKH